MKKRIVSLLLCLIMALSLIPTTAFATEVPNADSTSEVQAATNEIVVQDGWNGGGWDDNKYSLTQLGWNYADISQKFDRNGNPAGYKMNKVTGADDLSSHVKVKITNGTATTDMVKGMAVDVSALPGDAKVTISVDPGYYIAYVIFCCNDESGYNCQTVQTDGAFGQKGNEDGSAVEMSMQLLRDKRHDGRGYPYWLLVMVKKCPNPAYVGYDAGTLNFNGQLVDHADGTTWVSTYDTQKYTTAGADHTVLGISKAAQDAARAANLVFDGWKLTYYNDYSEEGNNFTNEVSSHVNIPTAADTSIKLFTHAKLVAQWKEVEITSGTLTVVKKVNAPMGTTTPDSFTITVNGQDKTVTAGGSVTFDDLPFGEYTITEANANVDGYNWTYTVSGLVDGKLNFTADTTVTVVNTYTKVFGDDIVNPASLTVFKKDARTDALLSGAEFQLLKKVGNDYVAVGTPVGTTSTGMITFTALEPGDYQLKETKAPANYVGWTGRVFEFTVVQNDEPTDAARYNETTKQFEKVYDCHIVLTSDLDEGFKDFYKNYSFANNELTVYNEKIGGKEIEVKKIVKAPYAPVGETEFTFYVTLGYDNNTSVFEDVDLLSDFHIYFKAKGADTATELTFDDVENRYSFTMKASSDEIGEGTLILTGTRNDLDRLAVSVWEDEDEAPENWEYADEPCVAILTYDKESNDYLLLNEDEEPVSVPFAFTNTYTKVVTNVTATFNVEKVVERQRGSRKPGKADFTFEAYYTDANGKLVKIDQTLTISTWGVGKYNASWDLVVPAAAFNDNGVASLTVKEVNGKKSGWTYDKTAYELIVTRDGKVSFPAKPLANAETDSAAVLTVTFTNSYYKHSFNGGDKPIESVKTGDMGIAMYAMTSLLSLGGAALVIKKRKDEE